VVATSAALVIRDLRLVLALAQRLHEVHGGAPLPACAGLDEPLEIAMDDVRRLEPQHLKAAHLCQLLPQPRPETRRLDDDARQIPDLVRDLGLVAEIGDEHDVALADHQ
jgi:hypothetical protein